VVPTAGLPSLVLGPGVLPGRQPATTLIGKSAAGCAAGTMIKAVAINNSVNDVLLRARRAALAIG